MQFIDSTEIYIRSGSGGNGMVSFKTASNKPKLGPDGGDGGHGGHVIIMGHAQLNTLSHLRYKTRFAAGDGERGGSSGKTGANGEDVFIKVPLGTELYDAESGRLLCEILGDGQCEVIASGGRRGLGNLRFLKATHQAPVEFTVGTPGLALNVRVELKLLADVGLAGLPNAGKSTLLSVMSSARPKIADYPFTTLVPNLGVVELKERGEFNLQSFVMADIPGLIEGASEGKGLGHAFLRHLERTKVIAYVIDCLPPDGARPSDVLKLLEGELHNYDKNLAERRSVVILNKIDAIESQEQSDMVSAEQQFMASMGYEVFAISAFFEDGLLRLKESLYGLVMEEKKIWREKLEERMHQSGASRLRPAALCGVDHADLVSFSSAIMDKRAFHIL
jgi:GTP-binding protein